MEEITTKSRTIKITKDSDGIWLEHGDIGFLLPDDELDQIMEEIKNLR